MATYEITAEMNLKKTIAETREVVQALNEFADNLERIEKKYTKPQESEEISKRNMKMWEEILRQKGGKEMTLDEAIERFKNNAEFERRNDNLQGCLEFILLVDWLQELKEYREILKAERR